MCSLYVTCSYYLFTPYLAISTVPQHLQILTTPLYALVERSGYSSVTGRVPLQAIRPALNDFRIGFTSMVGAQATKG